MRISNISAGALCTTSALVLPPLVFTLLVVLLVAFLVIAAAVGLRWFVRQSKPERADVIRLFRAWRGN